MHLKPGDEAPDFETINQNNEKVRLSDFRGKKVMLYFYPSDSTPTCTTQACNIRDNFERFQQNGVTVLGISTSGLKAHQNFIKKHELPFDLLVDKDHEINELYGVWAEKTTFGITYIGTLRTTFLIDEKGKIYKIIDDVKSKIHTDQVFGRN